MHQMSPAPPRIRTSSMLLNAVPNMMTELFPHPFGGRRKRGRREPSGQGSAAGATRIPGPLYSFQGDEDDQVQGHEGRPQRGATDRTARARDPGVWIGGPHADRPRREHAPNQREQSEPVARGYHHAPRPLQEAPLAGIRPNLLPAPLVV